MRFPKRLSTGFTGVVAVTALGLLAFYQAPTPKPNPADAAAPPVSPSNSEARVANKLLFGDLHMHTAWSFDAFSFKTTATPDDAYAFAQGASLKHPAGGVYKLDRPLDFLAVTDHAEFMGVLNAMQDPKNSLAELAVGHEVASPDPVTATEG